MLAQCDEFALRIGRRWGNVRRSHRKFMLRMNFATIEELPTTMIVSCVRSHNASVDRHYFFAMSRASVSRVDGSARPSTRSGRK